MVLKYEPAARAIREARQALPGGSPVICLSPQGKVQAEGLSGWADDAFWLDVDASVAEAFYNMMRLYTLRADLEMLETYEYHDDDPLDCPVMAVRGRDDPHAPLDSVKAWSHETRGSFTAREYPGGHFFFRGREAELLNLVNGSLGVAPEIGPCP